MRDYIFNVNLCDGHYADGTVVVSSENDDDATEQALSYVCEKLFKALPELDIEVSVDLVETSTEYQMSQGRSKL